MLTEVSCASDLIEGAQLAGVTIRSMHDVLLVQKAKRPLPFEHNFARDTFLILDLPQAFLSRAMGTLQVLGERNLGKTEWALAQFINPLYCTERNQLLDFREGVHNGVPCRLGTTSDAPHWLPDHLSARVLSCSERFP